MKIAHHLRRVTLAVTAAAGTALFASPISYAAPDAAPAAAAPAAAAPAADADPTGGKFTIDEALKGLPAKEKGVLTAVFETNHGKVTCDLYEAEAPNTVANFVGLARGLRPFKDPKTNKWVKKRFYDGLTFHRVIPDFMIQGGDPLGTGTGDPGYEFDDETASGLKFDKPALLAMANRGPGTNGSQFFITERETPHLDGRHTIFGSCQPLELVKKIARVPVGAMNKPEPAVTIKKVTITRVKAKKK